MNLLLDPFISTFEGKISLKQALTTHSNSSLHYRFDETQLAMMQMLSSLATVVLNPTLKELRTMIKEGITEREYDQALKLVNVDIFNQTKFMRSSPTEPKEPYKTDISKLVSGIESGGSANASGLFSDSSSVLVTCPDCMTVLNYNLHMNIKGECFGPTGATGIRGGGAMSVLISGANLAETILSNCVASDFFSTIHQNPKCINEPMWLSPPSEEIYFSHKIGLIRGLFALAYHIDYKIDDTACTCDICGHRSQQSITKLDRIKYTGNYGSTKNGRETKAGLWPHPYTPTKRTDGVEFVVSADNANWRSWEHLTSFIVGTELDQSKLFLPAPIIEQYKQLALGKPVRVLVGGNITNQGSIVGRIYDLYSMPQNWDKSLKDVIKVIEYGIKIKTYLGMSLNKIFASDFPKSFKTSIKVQAINSFVNQAQNIIQLILVEVDRQQSRALRTKAKDDLKKLARNTFSEVIKKYENDIKLFEVLIKGQKFLNNLLKNLK